MMRGMEAEPAADDRTKQFLELAARESGRPVEELRTEFEALSRGPGRISAEEYLRYALYDSATYTPSQKAAFIGDALHWPLVHRICNMGWYTVTEDKWIAAKLLVASGIPTPEIVAVADRTPRFYPGATAIRSLEDFRRFLAAWQGREFFGKQLRALQSRGIFRCERHDRESLFLTGRGEVGVAAFYENEIAPRQYIFQPVQRNHDVFQGICRNLTTVRIGVVVGRDALRLVFTFLKIPAGETLEDRFHPVGNIACGLAPETGEITSIRQRTALGAVSCDVHPENGRSLIGLRLPWWNDLLHHVATAARVFAPVRYQTYDIAICQQGPVVLEINIGGGFNAPQLVLQRGLLRTPFGRFLKECGIDIATVEPRRPATL